MKKIIKKAVTTILVSAIMLTSNVPTLAASLPGMIHETKEVKHISSGVVHEHIERFTTSGWWNINVVRVDLNNPYTEVQGMINPNGLSSRSTVSNMVDKTGAVAGINGDYFSYKPVPNSIGSLINKGEVISSPIEKAPYAAPSLYIDENNKVTIGYMDRSIKVRNKTQEKNISPYTINRLPDNFLNIGLINKSWGDKSIGNRFNKDLVEVVVENDVVIDVRINQAPVNIPKDGYVMFARGNNAKLLQEFNVGDELDLEIKVTPDLESINFAIGGGSIILKDGQATLTNIHSGGNNPRTGLGVNKDNTELMLVTIDGRGSFRGIGQKQFGELMKNLGAYNALNLDGGGSTTMAIKAVDEKKVKVANLPSGGSERKVVNGVGVYSNAPIEELDYIELEPDDNKMFLNHGRLFKVKAFDAHRHPLNIDSSKLSFTVEGIDGEFNGNKLIAKSTGIARVTAHYLDKTASCQVQVLDRVEHIDSYMKDFNIAKGGTKEISNFDAYDGNGNKAKIYREDVEFTTVNDIGYVDEKGIFHANSNDLAGAITVRDGNGVFNILVTVGNSKPLDRSNPKLPFASKLKDNKRKTKEKKSDGYSVAVTMDPQNLNEVVKYDASSKIKEELNKHDVSMFLGGGTSKFTTGINSKLKFHSDNNYKKSKFNDITFINLNTSKKGIRITNASQWGKFKNDLSSLDTKNLIISTSTPVFGPGGFADVKEANLFHELLEKLGEKGVNIFVVQKHTQTKSEVKDGVRYISLNSLKVNKPEDIKNLPILEFTVNGDDITFQLRPLFP